jgi:hypothetical protein
MKTTRPPGAAVTTAAPGATATAAEPLGMSATDCSVGADCGRQMMVSIDSAGGTFTANGAKTRITDGQLTPDADSESPLAPDAEPGGSYALTVRSDVGPRDSNVLPTAAEGETRYLFHCGYKPAGGEFFDVRPPRTTSTRDKDGDQ